MRYCCYRLFCMGSSADLLQQLFCHSDNVNGCLSLDMALNSKHSSTDKDSENEFAHSELDLVPTKFSSVNPDPLLFVTPEKKGLLKNFQKGDSASNPKINSLYPPDPELLVTPEKASSVLTNVNKRVDSCAPSTKNKVRFNIPESSSENSTSTLSPNTQSTYNESSTLSTVTEFDEGSSLTTEDASDFATKAALYTQRNPLADITFESHRNFDSTTTTDCSSLSNTSQRSFHKLLDMKGKKITQKHVTGVPVLPDTVKAANPTTKITTSKPISGHRKNTPAQAKIDKLTANQNNKVDSSLPNAVGRDDKISYLRKKSGLHKHQHSIRYINKETEEISSNELESPKYNSSVVRGQKLQQIKEEKFDAMNTITTRMENDRGLKSLVETKAAAGTNVDPEEILFSNLVEVDVALQDVVAAPEFRRVKRSHFVKSHSVAEPNIMDAFPPDLIQEKMMLDSRCFAVPSVELEQVPLSSVMSLYEHSLSWS